MKLDDYLREKDTKPTAFAVSIGVPPSTITRLLRGERRPGIGLLMKVTKATEGLVTASDFFEAAE